MNAETRIAPEVAPVDAPEVAADPRPRSAVSTGVGVVGLLGLLVWTGVARVFGMAGPLAALTGLLACGVPMLLWSIFVDKVHRSPTTGLDWRNPPRALKDISDIS